MAKSNMFVRLFGCGLLLLSSLVHQGSAQTNTTTAPAIVPGMVANSSTTTRPAPAIVPAQVANGSMTTRPGVLGSSSVSVIIATPPANMTVATGSSVTLTCGITNQYTGEFYWQTYRGNTFGSGSAMLVYRCTSTATSCPPTPGVSFTPPQAPSDKYTQSNMYGLTIDKVDWRDGARYFCNFLTGEVTAAASIVVIDEVTAQFVEIGPARAVGTTMVTQGELKCEVTFGAPIYNPDDAERSNRMPQLTMTFKGQTYSANVSSANPWGSQTIKITYEPGSPRDTLHRLLLTVARNLTTADIGQRITCSVMTVSPSYQSSTTSAYRGDSLKPWDIEIKKPNNTDGIVYVDDVVNCAAVNHPDAIVQWRAIRSSANVTHVDSPSLNVTEDMIGENLWECVLRDWANNEKKTKLFAFNVTENPNSQDGSNGMSEEEEARRRIALGVGLGIGLGLPILIVIIVIVVLLLRKRKSGSASTKNGKPAAGAGGGYAPLPAQTDQLPPPIYQPKTNAAAPPRNASPSPSDEPSMNQSGHGDLGGIGIRPASSVPSRSNSNINTSLSGKPLVSLGQPDSGPRPAGFADIGGGMGGRSSIPYADSLDSTSAASVPRSISMRSEASSVNPNRSGGPTYRTPQPRTGTATGV